MIVANHRGSREGEQPAEGLTNDGRAQMPHMHLLGGVGGAVVDHPSLPGMGCGGAPGEGVVSRVSRQPRVQRGGFQRKVDEARARDGHVAVGKDLGRQRRNQPVCDGAGIEFTLFGVAENSIRLEVSMLGIRRLHVRRKRVRIKPGGGRGRREGRFKARSEME